MNFDCGIQGFVSRTIAFPRIRMMRYSSLDLKKKKKIMKEKLDENSIHFVYAGLEAYRS